MCGIFAYVGNRNASETIVSGLKRLEYRGYDSWGVAVISPKGIKTAKKVGSIGDFGKLDSLPESNLGVGHTRWATHGGVTFKNAHPHFSKNKSFVLAQNGIVENYQELKTKLIDKGFRFVTETDTEVIVRLVEMYLEKDNSLLGSIKLAFADLTGRNTIIVLSQDGHLIAVRNGSPLVIGVGDDELFIASDSLSFADKTNKVVFVEDMQIVEYLNSDLSIYDLSQERNIPIKEIELDQQDISISKDGYKHFMLKEIFEERYILKNAVNYSIKELDPLLQDMKEAKMVFTIGAGGAFYAADQVAYLLRKIAGIKALGIRSYEIDSYLHFMRKGDIIIAISQSGETADTIEALQMVQKRGVKIASAVNMVGSTITRMSDYSFFSRIGSEICVLSTKSGMAQVAFGYMIAKSLAGKYKEIEPSISRMQTFLDKKYLTKNLVSQTKRIAKKLYTKKHIFLLGKGTNNLVANIGALNIKEASYIHAEGFAAGELKHGVIALIEKGTPVICFVDNDKDKEYMIGTTAEVKARGAYIIGIGSENNELFDEFIPLPTISKIDAAVIGNIIPCQLLAYHLAIYNGHNPDKPRNLAKSVTVK